jgi:hypothetical protein
MNIKDALLNQEGSLADNFKKGSSDTDASLQPCEPKAKRNPKFYSLSFRVSNRQSSRRARAALRIVFSWGFSERSICE